MLIGWIVLILAILVILALVGLGWDTFFTGVKKGVEKIGNLPEIKNITNKAKNEFDTIVGNSTADIVTILFQKIWNRICNLNNKHQMKGSCQPRVWHPFHRFWTFWYFRWTEPKTESLSLLNCAQQNLKWFMKNI